MLSVRPAATLSPTAPHSQDFHAVFVLGWTWTSASDCVMWRLTTLRTALNKNCNVECVGEMSSHCWPNSPPTVSSFAWWIICKSSTLRILVSCSSKVPLRLLDLSIFAILEIQNQKNYCSKIHLGFENCNHKKRTVEKKPKQLLIVCLADKRQEEIRGWGVAFRMKEREERECQKLGFLCSWAVPTRWNCSQLMFVAQIRYNRAPLGHCWQTFAMGLQIGGCYVCPHCWSIRSLASFGLTVTTSLPFTHKTHLFSHCFQPIFLSFVLKLRLLSFRHQRSSLSQKSSSKNETNSSQCYASLVSRR